MNKITIVGRLTANPELKQTQNGVAVATFSIASDRTYDRENTDFFNCEAWRNTGEKIAKYCKKGKEVVCFGEVHIDRYNKNGENRTITKVKVEDIKFVGPKSDIEEQSEPQTEVPENLVETADEDVPF